jgi:hypothetical protein
MPLRLAWVNFYGYKSNGDYCMAFDEAEQLAKYMNKKHRDLHHWVEGGKTPQQDAAAARAALAKVADKTPLDIDAKARLENMLG